MNGAFTKLVIANQRRVKLTIHAFVVKKWDTERTFDPK